jgi:hypothetical protein
MAYKTFFYRRPGGFSMSRDPSVSSEGSANRSLAVAALLLMSRYGIEHR